MASIGVALDAYKADFGDYPRAEQNYTGFAVLCKALISPGPGEGLWYSATLHIIDAGDCVLSGRGFVRAPEIAMIRAGKYQAVSVHSDDMKLGDKVVTLTQWFAPGVGLVKQVADFGGKKTTLELEKFEAGK